MKQRSSFLMSLLAISFPWVVLLLNDNPGGAIFALILQATAIGWIPASIWAWRVVHPKQKASVTKQKRTLKISKEKGTHVRKLTGKRKTKT